MDKRYDIILDQFQKFKNNTTTLLKDLDPIDLKDMYAEMELIIMNKQVKNREHETVDLDYHGCKIPIDKNIAPLIELMWNLGINTRNSCEDNIPKNYIWIEFESASDIEKFMSLLFIGEKIGGTETGAFLCKPAPNHWEYKLSMFSEMSYKDEDRLDNPDLSQEEFEELYNVTTISDISMSISVRFPMADYQWVFEKLSGYD